MTVPTHTPLASVAEQTRVAGEITRLWTEAAANVGTDTGQNTELVANRMRDDQQQAEAVANAARDGQQDAELAVMVSRSQVNAGGGGCHTLTVCPIGTLSAVALVLPSESAPFATSGNGLVVDLNTQEAMVLAPWADVYPTDSISLEWEQQTNGTVYWRWMADGAVVVQGGLCDNSGGSNNPIAGVYPALYHGTGAYSAQVDVPTMIVTGAGTVNGSLTFKVRRGNDQWLSPYSCHNAAPGVVTNEGQDGSGAVILHMHLRVLLASGSVVGHSFPLHFKALRVGKANQ